MTEALTHAEKLALLLAPVLCALLIRFLMPWAPRWGLVDHPNARKVHVHPTPLIGGLAMLIIVLLLQVLVGHAPFGSWSLVLAVLVVAAIGLADDARELSHRAKFVAQALGGIIIVSGTSVWVTGFGDLVGIGNLELGKWGLLVTVISMVGVMNAINMIDGLDGLAASVSLMSVLVLAGIALGNGQPGLVFELLLIAGALLGFLAHNLRIRGRARAAVFMGDTGGLIIGLLLAWYAIKLGGGATSAVKPITAVWILAVPLLDMGSVMLLRLSQGTSPFHADQQHMHHLLLRAGYSVNQVVGLMAALALGLGVAGVACEIRGLPQPVMFAVFLGLWGGYFAALKYPGAIPRALRRVLRPAGNQAGMPA